ncbi:MAG: archaeosine biosynthesis radical SAM protein RaSEA [Thermoplasmata archaeon]
MDPEFPKRFRDKRSSKTDLVTTWHGEEILNGNPAGTFAIIFRTRGCSWSYRSGCTMCGYHTDTNPGVKEQDLVRQLGEAVDRYRGEDIVKIYTSGSFFDTNEIPESLASTILSSFDSELTVVETRPEYVSREVLNSMCGHVNTLEVAIGLESANDFVLEHSINKGFTYQNYVTARDKVLQEGARLRTYLLLKPPFLTEDEAIQDTINSVNAVYHPENTISINPVNVQRYSPLESLWRRKLYRPPWLWSLIEVIKNTDKNMVISNAGLGSVRGAHNCGRCDRTVVDVLRKFNITQDRDVLEDIPQCSCKENWKAQNRLEPYMYFRGNPEILSHRYAGYV